MGFGAGLLIAAVAIVHVFISHFAVGGGLFLVLTERKARRDGDAALLGWLKAHTRFFVLATVVLGVVTGVGIWFTIGLISPSATSGLIHIYVWGWAIEWVFFFVEITAALLYLYGWDKLDPRRHEEFGWIYFIAAYASLVVINGIITFMLTSGRWTDTRRFWTGFFNPTYFPSLAVRTCIALALAGIYALVTASVQKDAALKARLVRWNARWILPTLALLPACIWWYIRSIPPDIWAGAHGPMPTATHFAGAAAVLAAATFALALLARLRPGHVSLGLSLPTALVAFGAMGSFEFVREAVRKPYLISNYLYANSLYAAPEARDGGLDVDHIDDAGLLATAKWARPDLPAGDRVAAGREVFRLECSICHTADGYRGIRSYLALRQWPHDRLLIMLGSLDGMHDGAMPPFAGTDDEKADLGAYLESLQPAGPAAPGMPAGKWVFVQNCAMCHRVTPDDSVFRKLPANPAVAANALKSLPNLFTLMPDLRLSDGERAALVEWVEAERAGPLRKGGS